MSIPHRADWRYELKFVCDGWRLAQARAWIRLHPAGFVTTYPPRRVNSLYFDTHHLRGANENLAGVGERQKLRLRWYGEDMEDIRPVWEIKQKRGAVGRKFQHPLPCPLDLRRPWAAILPDLLVHLPSGWLPRIGTMERPTLLNHYRREYYATPDGKVRLTLDFEQVAYDQRWQARPNLTTPLLQPDRIVIEVKAPVGAEAPYAGHACLSAIAASLPIPRQRNSKYVTALLHSLG